MEPSSPNENLPEHAGLRSLFAKFDSDLREGKNPRIEEILDASDQESHLELLKGLVEKEVHFLIEQGVPVSPKKYMERFPELAQNQGDWNFETLIAQEHLATTLAAINTDPEKSRPNKRNEFQNNTSNNDGEKDINTFGDYQLIEEIARGGMGVVYKAKQQKANRMVALKMILTGSLADQEAIDRFYTEAEAAANLDHPNIVPVYDVGSVDGFHYFSMAFIEGESFSELVSENPLEPRRAAELMKQVTDAMVYAHNRQIIHRDIKPQNILLDKDGNAKITDFGLAKRVEDNSNLTATGAIMGTPSYMPPEQAMGDMNKVGPSADVYALGAVFYHLVTGRPPFRAATVMETLRQVIAEEPTSPRRLNRAIDLDVETMILKLLQKSPANRYLTAEEFSEDLNRYLEHVPIKARPTSTLEHTWRWAKRNRVVAGLLSAVVVTVFSMLALSSYSAVVYRNMATTESTLRAEEKQLRLKMSESLYIAEMNKAEDVLSKPSMEATANSILGRWIPMNPTYSKVAADTSIDYRGWEWYFLISNTERNRVPIPGRIRCGDVSITDQMAFGMKNSFGAIRFRQERGGISWNAHPKLTVAIKWSPDGKNIASAGLDGSVKLWSYQPRKQLGQMKHDSAVRSLSFDPQGEKLLTHAEDGLLRIWNLNTFKVIQTIDEGASKNPTSAWSPDGKFIAFSAKPKDGKYPLKIWDTKTNTIVSTILEDAHSNTIEDLDWSPDSKKLITGSLDRSVRIWDRGQAKLIRIQSERTQPIRAVAWSPDGKLVAAGGNDIVVKVWNADNGEFVKAFGHKGGEYSSISSLSWKSNSGSLVSTLETGAYEVMDLEDDLPITKIQIDSTKMGSRIASVAFHPNEKKLSATYDQQSIVWTKKKETSENKKDLLCWSYDNSMSAFLSDKKLTIKQGDQILFVKPLKELPKKLIWSPKANSLLLLSENSVEIWRDQHASKLTTISKAEKLKTGTFDCLTWSSDGEKIAMGTHLGHLFVFFSKTGEKDFSFQIKKKAFRPVRIRAIAWQPASSIFAIGASNNMLFFFDANRIPRKKGEKLVDRGLSAHTSHLRTLAWSPDGKRLASGSGDRTVKIWKIETKTIEEIAHKNVLTIEHDAEIRDLAWSGDGRQLVSLSDKGTVRIFDSDIGYREQEFLEKNPDMIQWSYLKDQ